MKDEADMKREVRGDRLALKRAAILAIATSLAACSTLGASGPTTANIRDVSEENYQNTGIQIVELEGGVLGRLEQYAQSSNFSEVFGQIAPSGEVIGRGDVLDIAIWEAPPAVLFGVTTTDLSLAANPQVAQSAAIPQQMVDEKGVVRVPFVGEILAVGRTPAEIERDIVTSLRERAHDPQVVVRLVQNEARTVTVLGEVTASTRMPLTARGERLLDAIASAGGTREPVDRSIVQLTRNDAVVAMPLLQVVSDPAQNVPLLPEDVVTVLHEPFSFVALGSVATSAEIPFDGAGLTLAEALGRAGGLNDRRADVKGVFVFRLEQPAAFGEALPGDALTAADGRVPVVYRLDLSDPASLFAMRDFSIRDEDILYVSTAPGADLQRFVSTISSAAFSIIGITNAFQNNN